MSLRRAHFLRCFFALLFAGCAMLAVSQKKTAPNEVYIDKEGVLRWTGSHKEASFFGVNYTVPFAYGYRSHKALGLDLEKAIDADVYHFSRLGLDAFRVHIWDTEISDSLGNLLENEHLRLFDYLITIPIRDPFERPSPQREVTRIQLQEQQMEITLRDLGQDFSVRALNSGNSYEGKSSAGTLLIRPGVYLLTAAGNNGVFAGLDTTFFAPQPFSTVPFVVHQPLRSVTAGQPFAVRATIAGTDTLDKILLELRNAANRWQTVLMHPDGAVSFVAQVPAPMASAGLFNYRIIIQKSDGTFYTFPAGIKGDPYAWDYTNNDTWQTFVMNGSAPITLFSATADKSHVMIYNPDWRNNSVSFATADDPENLVLKTEMRKPAPGAIMGWQLYVGDKCIGRSGDLTRFTTLSIKLKANGPSNTKVKLALINSDAEAFSATFTAAGEMKTIDIPLNALKKDSMLLLPRPFPFFQPLQFLSAADQPFDLNHLDKLELRFWPDGPQGQQTCGLEVEYIQLH